MQKTDEMFWTLPHTFSDVRSYGAMSSELHCLWCEMQTSLSTPGLRSEALLHAQPSVAVPLAACFLRYKLTMLVCVTLVGIGLLHTFS